MYGNKPNASMIRDALNRHLELKNLNTLPGDIRKDISRGIAILLEED